MRPFTVALTGGIASGKSEVERRFAALGVPVIDADIVSRELVAPGMPALADIVTVFGEPMLDATGALDRRAMRNLVFNDEESRKRLEAILHPRVREEIFVRAHRAHGAYVLLVIPLLVETGAYDWVDRVLVVDVPREQQLARLVARDKTTPALAEAILDAQVTREQRLAATDDVIDNGGEQAALDRQVAELHRRYLALAADRD